MTDDSRMPVRLFQVGTALPTLSKAIRQENINRYAEASRDFNPIHIDEDFARKTPLGGTVAHGMMLLAYISEMMTAAFGMDWVAGGRMDIRFKTPARPGDAITVSGRVAAIEEGANGTTVRCSVLCRNQSGETVITGETAVTLKPAPPER